MQFFFCGLLLSTLNHKTATSSTYDYYDLKSSAVDFSNATVISDGYNGIYWNHDHSYDTAIAVDSNDRVHIVWADDTDGAWGTDTEIMYATYTTATGWSNVTVISDGYDDTYWNHDHSYKPAIAVDSSDRVHVVWEDDTNGAWGTDREIMYANFTTATGWSNVTVISDGYDDTYWNFDGSFNPAITVDSSDRVHVVWHDYTAGAWGTDPEIMYTNFTIATGWSNVTVISDGYDDTYWNEDDCYYPAITVDSSDRVHVVWYDDADGVWGTDAEIMYDNFTTATGWSNVTVISDGYDGSYWNDEYSNFPAITVDSSDRVHVVWYDDTNGTWGTDREIMYVNFTTAIGWSNVTVISDGYSGVYWNDDYSEMPAITIDNSDKIHVVWHDDTNGTWGTDREIMYVNFAMPTPPLNPSILINNGDANTNSVLVGLTLSADGAEEMCFRNGTTGAWTSWEAYATAKQLYLEGSINNTAYSIYVKFRKGSGETTPIGDSILYLTFLPLNPSIIINNGDASTNSTLVSLTLSADGATEMCFRNGTTGSWSSWEAYTTAKQLYLEGSINNTAYSIYAKFRNAIGETSPIGDSILYLIVEEEIPPVIPGYPVGLIFILLLGEIGVITIVKKSKRIILIK